MSRCRSCGAEVLWVEFAGGRKAPMDPVPCRNGNLLVTKSRSTGVLRARVVAAGETVPPDRNLYLSHFATCPEAGRWRAR